MHDVWMGCMDDAWTVTMTDVLHELRMGCMDDACTGALKGVMYDLLTVVILSGFHAGNLPWFSPHNYRGFSMGLQQMATS